MSARHSERRLELELRAAEALREALKIITDDAEAIADTVEGETNLHEAIAAVLSDLSDDEALVTALSEREAAIAQRKARILARAQARRSAIERAMSIAELQKLELAEATLSLRKVSPSLDVYDEAAVPQCYFKAIPKLDRAALKKVLSEGLELPGARLTNGGQSLTVRRA